MDFTENEIENIIENSFKCGMCYGMAYAILGDRYPHEKLIIASRELMGAVFPHSKIKNIGKQVMH